MKKNNCCKICGRLDYDDNGAYLVSRACGEKRRKHPVPIFELCMSVTLLLCTFFATLFAIQISIYRDIALNPSRIKPWRYTDNPDFYSVFMYNMEPHILWVGPLLWVFVAVLFALTVIFAIKVSKKLSKKPIV